MAENDRPGYSFDPGPPPEVSRFFRNKTVRDSFSFQDVEPEEHAVAFAVAKATKQDVLGDIRDAVQSAIDDGKTLDQFRKELTPVLQAKGWWGRKLVTDPLTGETDAVQLGSPRRLRTIYNANLRSARAAGQWERIERTKKLLPFLEYRLGPSEVHRPAHEAKEGLILPVDDPFWNEWMPPNGWGCKCWVRQITRTEAERRGVSTAPRVPAHDHVNKRTGEVRAVPAGIDPGWDRNPGQLRLKAVTDLLEGKLASATEDVARAALRDIATSWRVQRILRGASGSAPVALLPPELTRALSGERLLRIDSNTARHIVDEKVGEYRELLLVALEHLPDAAEAFLSTSGGRPSWSVSLQDIFTGRRTDLFLVLWLDGDGHPVIRTIFRAPRAYWRKQAGRDDVQVLELK